MEGSGEHLVYDDAQRADIGPMIGLPGPLFRGHIRGSPQNFTGPPYRRHEGRGGDTKVRHFHLYSLIDQYVLRLYISVDNAKRMCTSERVCNLLGDLNCPFFIQRSPCNQRSQVFRHVLKDHERPTFMVAHVNDLNDIFVFD